MLGKSWVFGKFGENVESDICEFCELVDGGVLGLFWLFGSISLRGREKKNLAGVQEKERSEQTKELRMIFIGYHKNLGTKKKAKFTNSPDTVDQQSYFKNKK